MHRTTSTGERGFTMVELLVVILIIGILAMIALPAFLAQRMKGEDTDAQAMARTVATAAITYHTNEGTFDASIDDLIRIEPAINAGSEDLVYSGTEDTFEVSETSRSHTEFTIRRGADGRLTRSCSIADRGLCNSASQW